MEESLTRFQYQYPIVRGEFSANIVKFQNPRSQYVSDLLMEFGMMDILPHFRQSCQYCHLNMYNRVRQGIMMRERSDFILGTDQRRFKMVVIRGIRNQPLDHLTLQASLLICITKASHQCDVGGLPAKMVTVHGVGEDTGS